MRVYFKNTNYAGCRMFDGLDYRCKHCVETILEVQSSYVAHYFAKCRVVESRNTAARGVERWDGCAYCDCTSQPLGNYNVKSAINVSCVTGLNPS